VSDPLPARPNLEWLRKTAKDRLRELRTAGAGAAKLADAQLAVARAYGFPSWRRLKAHVDRMAAATSASPAGPTTADAEVAEFLEHVGTGRIEQARAMLDANPSLVNMIGPHPFWGGRPQALHVAIEAKRREMFDLLIERGADVNGSNDLYDEWSPLMIAINRDQADIRDELLRHRARVGLFEALMLGDDQLVERWLRSGRLPETTPNGGSTLAFARTPFAIDRLLDLHAPADLRDRWGSTPLDAMSRLGVRGRALVAHMIRRGVAAQPKDYARIGDTAALARLIEADPAIARQDAVLIAAIDVGDRVLVAWLLERGANVNARTEAGSRGTALHCAAWNGDVPMVALLVEAGADRHARDEEHDNTPEGWARTAVTVTNNPACADVVAYLAGLQPHSPRS
jgi:ankyrin repeat protein